MIPDTRNGFDKTVSISLQYEAQTTIGQGNDGLETVVFFDKVPYTVKKTTYKVLATQAEWEKLIEDMRLSYIDFSRSKRGDHLDTVSPGSRVIIENTEYFDGSYSISEYSNNVLNPIPDTWGAVELRSLSIPVGGHWEGKSAIRNKLFFTTPAYGEQATKTYTAQAATEVIGGTATFAGVTGRVTNVGLSNPRHLGYEGPIIYDISVSLQSQIGKSVKV